MQVGRLGSLDGSRQFADVGICDGAHAEPILGPGRILLRLVRLT